MSKLAYTFYIEKLLEDDNHKVKLLLQGKGYIFVWLSISFKLSMVIVYFLCMRSIKTISWYTTKEHILIILI